MCNLSEYLKLVRGRIIYHFGVFDVLFVRSLVSKFGRQTSMNKSKSDFSDDTEASNMTGRSFRGYRGFAATADVKAFS